MKNNIKLFTVGVFLAFLAVKNKTFATEYSKNSNKTNIINFLDENFQFDVNNDVKKIEPKLKDIIIYGSVEEYIETVVKSNKTKNFNFPFDFFNNLDRKKSNDNSCIDNSCNSYIFDNYNNKNLEKDLEKYEKYYDGFYENSDDTKKLSNNSNEKKNINDSNINCIVTNCIVNDSNDNFEDNNENFSEDDNMYCDDQLENHRVDDLYDSLNKYRRKFSDGFYESDNITSINNKNEILDFLTNNFKKYLEIYNKKEKLDILKFLNCDFFLYVIFFKKENLKDVICNMVSEEYNKDIFNEVSRIQEHFLHNIKLGIKTYESSLDNFINSNSNYSMINSDPSKIFIDFIKKIENKNDDDDKDDIEMKITNNFICKVEGLMCKLYDYIFNNCLSYNFSDKLYELYNAMCSEKLHKLYNEMHFSNNTEYKNNYNKTEISRKKSEIDMKNNTEIKMINKKRKRKEKKNKKS